MGKMTLENLFNKEMIYLLRAIHKQCEQFFGHFEPKYDKIHKLNSIRKIGNIC